MTDRRRAWLILGAAGLGIAVLAVALFVPSPTIRTPADMLARTPVEDALVLYIDFSALRQGGLLQLLDGSKAGEELDYQAFVAKTEFDYKKDLDAALVSFRPEAVYFLVKGRFDWNRLRSYADEQGGTCLGDFCQMPGNQPQRHISFLRLGSDAMALAAGSDRAAAARLQKRVRDSRPVTTPAGPVWLWIPSSTLKNNASFPAGTRMFARAIEDAEKITIEVGPTGDRFEARLEASCRSEQDAAALATQLAHATSLLQEMISREKQKPNVEDLSGVLTAGVFHREGRRVIGRWPLERAFVNAILGGPR